MLPDPLTLQRIPPSQLPKRLLLALLFVAAVALVGFGIPVVWLLIGAWVQGASGLTHMTVETALAVYPGVAITYAIVGWFASWIAERAGWSGDALPRRRPSHPWMRSMRDEPERTEPATPIEKLFIVTAGSVSIAFMTWFLLWAGNPLPSGT